MLNGRMYEDFFVKIFANELILGINNKKLPYEYE